MPVCIMLANCTGNGFGEFYNDYRLEPFKTGSKIDEKRHDLYCNINTVAVEYRASRGGYRYLTNAVVLGPLLKLIVPRYL